jgi:hypothetical protein
LEQDLLPVAAKEDSLKTTLWASVLSPNWCCCNE